MTRPPFVSVVSKQVRRAVRGIPRPCRGGPWPPRGTGPRVFRVSTGAGSSPYGKRHCRKDCHMSRNTVLLFPGQGADVPGALNTLSAEVPELRYTSRKVYRSSGTSALRVLSAPG